MKILHCSSAKSWRGGEQQLAYLVEELSALGIEQQVLCMRGSELEQHCRKQNIVHFSYKKRFSANPFVGQMIKKICLKEGISLIHTHDSHAHTFACLAAAMGNKPPVVVSRRVDFPVKNTRLSFWKYNHPAVKKIVCVSDSIARITAPALRNPSRLATIHSGIDLARFRFKNSGILHREYQLPPDRLIIANIAAMAPHKDYFTFVDTARLLLERGVPASFFIIGADGGEEAHIRKHVEDKGLQGNVLFTGFRTDIPQILPEIDLFLFTSKTEGLGTSLLDAFACRVPVVACRAGGIPEIVMEEETGLTAEVGDPSGLADQVLRIFQEEGLRDRLVEKALEKVREFSKQSMAQKTLEIYRTL